jgi:hypothetical protein
LQPSINTVNARFFPPLFLAVQEKICQKICLLENRCEDNRHLTDVKVDTNAGGKLSLDSDTGQFVLIISK